MIHPCNKHYAPLDQNRELGKEKFMKKSLLTRERLSLKIISLDMQLALVYAFVCLFHDANVYPVIRGSVNLDFARIAAPYLYRTNGIGTQINARKAQNMLPHWSPAFSKR